MEALSQEEIRAAVHLALAEDIGSGDATTSAIVPPGAFARASVRAREPLVVAGLAVAEAAFRELSPDLEIVLVSRDGQRVAAGAELLKISGPAAAILSAERVALNYLQRLSGIATLTAQFVNAVSGTRARILDTRKTTPGLRRLEKYAVVCGGGTNHRFGLFDQVLIKDNHLAVLAGARPGPVAAAVNKARAASPRLRIQVEVDTLEQLEQALEASVDLVLLDNMGPEQLRLAVQRCKGRAQSEASGGVTLSNVRAIAETGVDFISVGALTHSARAVDIGLDFET